MEGLAQVFDALLKQGILPAAFIIGTIAFFLALIGKIPTGNDGIEIQPFPRFFLGLFGFVFAFAGIGGALFGIFAVTINSSSGSVVGAATFAPSSQVVVTPYIPTAPAQSSSQPRLMDQEATGASVRREYTLNLSQNEMVVGDAYDVEDRGIMGCVVFYKRGPVNLNFAVMDGIWLQYSGVQTQAQADELIQDRYNYLANTHSFCKNAQVQIIELSN